MSQQVNSASLEGDAVLLWPLTTGAPVPSLIEKSSRAYAIDLFWTWKLPVSRDLTHTNVLDSWAVGLVCWHNCCLKSPDCDLQVHPAPEEVADMRLHPPPLTVYPEMINEKGGCGLFVLYNGHWIETQGRLLAFFLIHEGQRQSKDQSEE